MMEFSISLPLLTLILFGVMDIGNLLNHYLILAQNASEVARFGSAVADLNTGKSCRGYTQQPLTCSSETAVNHKNLLDRAELLVSLSRLPMFTDFTYEIEYETPATAPSGVAPDVVYVNINTRFRGVMPPFDDIPISVRARAAYLY